MGGASSINVADSNSGIILTYGTHALVANSTVSGEYTIATNFDGTTSNLYVNNVLISQTTPTIASGAKMIKIGEDYNGLIKNLKFWNYAKRFYIDIKIVFHYGSFDNVYGDADVNAAAAAGHVFDNTSAGTYTWGIITLPSTASNQTTYTWTPTSALTGVDVLMVAGGGGGGGRDAGGGGAGGLLHHTNQTISSGLKTIVVGNGGLGGLGHNNTTNEIGSNGNDTSFTGLTTVNGGGGGGGGQYNGVSGGSGGGGGHGGSGGSSTSEQGYDGGTAVGLGTDGAGGGGAGGAGTDGAAGDGGVGLDKSSIFGTTYGDSGWFASGGGGGIRSGTAGGSSQGGGGSGSVGTSNASDGNKHTGGGGGGAGYSGTSNGRHGGDGGSGIVIVITS
jgi:hypothetical protein